MNKHCTQSDPRIQVRIQCRCEWNPRLLQSVSAPGFCVDFTGAPRLTGIFRMCHDLYSRFSCVFDSEILNIKSQCARLYTCSIRRTSFSSIHSRHIRCSLESPVLAQPEAILSIRDIFLLACRRIHTDLKTEAIHIYRTRMYVRRASRVRDARCTDIRQHARRATC